MAKNSVVFTDEQFIIFVEHLICGLEFLRN